MSPTKIYCTTKQRFSDNNTSGKHSQTRSNIVDPAKNSCCATSKPRPESYLPALKRKVLKCFCSHEWNLTSSYQLRTATSHAAFTTLDSSEPSSPIQINAVYTKIELSKIPIRSKLLLHAKSAKRSLRPSKSAARLKHPQSLILQTATV